MADGRRSRERYGEAARITRGWRQSDLNQREYCEAQGLSLKAFGNRRAMRRWASRSVYHDAASSRTEGPLGPGLHRHAQLCGVHDYAECGAAGGISPLFSNRLV
jgi:hypothetical protein